MVWLTGTARVQEVLIPKGRESGLVLQAPRRLNKLLWLAIGGGREDTELFEPVHDPDPNQGPYRELAVCGNLAPGSAYWDRLIRRAGQFGTHWGLPLLPDAFRQYFVFREIYCFPLDEFRRMARLVSALDLLLEARYADRRPQEKLRDALARLAAMPLDDLVPRGGRWPEPAVLRGGKSQIWYFQTRPETPAVEMYPELIAQFSKRDIPDGYRRDPYHPIRLLKQRAADLRSLSEMQEYCDQIRLGVKAYVETEPPSLWSFIQEEWVRRYDRGNRNAYCCYKDPQGRPCGSRLPLYAPANRRYCAKHQKLRDLEFKRAYARKRRGRSGGARRAEDR